MPLILQSSLSTPGKVSNCVKIKFNVSCYRQVNFKSTAPAGSENAAGLTSGLCYQVWRNLPFRWFWKPGGYLYLAKREEALEARVSWGLLGQNILPFSMCEPAVHRWYRTLLTLLALDWLGKEPILGQLNRELMGWMSKQIAVSLYYLNSLFFLQSVSMRKLDKSCVFFPTPSPN